MTTLQSADPILAIGREIAVLDARYDKLNGLETDAEMAGNMLAMMHYRRAMECVEKRARTLKHALSCYEAQSLEGAMIQLGWLNVLVDDLAAAEANERPALQREMERLTMSAIRAIERTTDSDLDAMGLRVLRNNCLDPWARDEDHLAKVEAMSEQEPKAAD